jgi:hypothetical protein
MAGFEMSTEVSSLKRASQLNAVFFRLKVESTG